MSARPLASPRAGLDHEEKRWSAHSPEISSRQDEVAIIELRAQTLSSSCNSESLAAAGQRLCGAFAGMQKADETTHASPTAVRNRNASAPKSISVSSDKVPRHN